MSYLLFIMSYAYLLCLIYYVLFIMSYLLCLMLIYYVLCLFIMSYLLLLCTFSGKDPSLGHKTTLKQSETVKNNEKRYLLHRSYHFVIVFNRFTVKCRFVA